MFPARGKMKRAITSVLTATLLSSGFVSLPAQASEPDYYPFGPQNDVSLQEALDAGWEICYQGNYYDSASLYGNDGILESLCTGDYLMLAGAWEETPETLAVLAAAPREDVLYDVGLGAEAYHLANGTRWYFSANYSWGFVSTGETPSRNTCDFARGDFTPLTLCWHTENDLMYEGYLLAGVEDVGLGGPDAQRFVLQPGSASSQPTPVPYTGPVVTNDPVVGSSNGTVTFRGSDLDEVTSATIAGVSSTIVSKSPGALTLRAPTGLVQGMHDVVLSYGTTESIILQNGLILQDSIKVWTQLQADKTVKMYAKNIIGEGKIQFFHNNNEIAWVRASNALNPKLREANGSHYLVRTRSLVAGKNAFEIYDDGKRIWRAAYSR
jgi:hypothetical protein